MIISGEFGDNPFSNQLICELSAELLKSVAKDVLSISCRQVLILTLGRCPPNMSLSDRVCISSVHVS